MGKSNKKAKSDRINALRKQYDAFLEQDKKRKERNEYILGKLDKMRYSTALVPVRHKINSLNNGAPLVHHLGYHQNDSPIREFQSSVTNLNKQVPDMQVRINEEISLIEEISKKYILIPKSTSLLNSYSQNRLPNLERPLSKERGSEIYPVRDISEKDEKSNSNENSDWRSKYEILNILKNEEKGTSQYEIRADDAIPPEPIPDKKVSLIDDPAEYDIQNVRIESTAKKLDDLSVTDLSKPYDKINNELKNNTDNKLEKINIPFTDNTDDVSVKLHDMKLEEQNSSINGGVSTGLKNDKIEPELDAQLTYSVSHVENTYNENVIEESTYPVSNEFIANEKNVLSEYEKSVPEQAVYANEQHDFSQLQLEESCNDAPLISNTEYDIQNQAEPIEEAYVQKETPNQNIVMEPAYNEEDVLATQIDTNPIYDNSHQEETVQGKNENPTEISEPTEDLKAETNDTFYSEQVDENYAYHQEEYPQGQEYAYYEGTQPEAYHEELNSQEEVTQGYDPNYNQQYEASDPNYVQGSNDEQVYEQTSQQYKETEGYQPQPEYDMMQYDQQNYETQEQDGQVLHYEEGYTEQQHIVEAAEEHHVGESYDNQNVESVGEQPIGVAMEEQPAVEIQNSNIENMPMSELPTSKS